MVECASWFVCSTRWPRRLTRTGCRKWWGEDRRSFPMIQGTRCPAGMNCGRFYATITRLLVQPPTTPSAPTYEPSLSLSLSVLNLISSSISLSGACRRRSRCCEFPPCRSDLSTPLRRRQSEVHLSRVSLHCSQPGLSGMATPPSPVIRRTHNAGL